MLEKVFALLMVVAMGGFTIKKLWGVDLDTRRMARVGVVSALTVMLYMIKLVPFPQGGGCSLLSVLPIMVLTIVAGVEEGLLCGIVVAFVKLIIAPPIFLMQVPLDYFGAMMALALTGIYGSKTKAKIFAGAMTASAVSICFSVMSGIIFFGQYAPEGMHTWVYSLIYNMTGYGVEAVLGSIVLVMLPLAAFRKAVKLDTIRA